MKKFKEKKEKTPKPNSYEMTRRLEIVEELLIKGLSSVQIRGYLWEKMGILLHKKSVEIYVTKINKKLEAAKAPHREREIQKAIKRFNLWMSKSDMIGDYRQAAKIQGMLCKLLGLNAPDKMEMKAEVTEMPAIDFSKLSTEKLKILKALLEEARPDKKEKKDE